jgi:hypothetical protein
VPQLLSVVPQNKDSSNGLMVVKLFGRGVSTDCTPEARVNGEPVEVTKGGLVEGAVYATIDAPALRNRRVGERYLEVELIAYSKGTPVENITHLRFAE